VPEVKGIDIPSAPRLRFSDVCVQLRSHTQQMTLAQWKQPEMYTSLLLVVVNADTDTGGYSSGAGHTVLAELGSHTSCF